MWRCSCRATTTIGRQTQRWLGMTSRNGDRGIANAALGMPMLGETKPPPLPTNEAKRATRSGQIRGDSSTGTLDDILSQKTRHERIWHQWYKGARKRKVHELYGRTLLAVEASYEQPAMQYASAVCECFRKTRLDEKTIEEAYKNWQKYFNYVHKRVRDKLGPKKAHSGASPGYGLLPVPISRMLSKLRRLNIDQFDRFWVHVARSPLAVEMIPLLFDYLCIKKEFDTARYILHHIGDAKFLEIADQHRDRNQKTIYSHGVNFGLNVLLHKYIRTTGPDGMCVYWKQMYEAIQSLNPEIEIALLPSITHHLARRVPSYSYYEFYKLFLLRRVNLFNPKMSIFLKALYAGSDVGKQLVSSTDEIIQAHAKEGGSDTTTVDKVYAHATFDAEFYKYLLGRLSKQKDSTKTGWFLENVILKNCNNPRTLAEALRLLIIRAVEMEGMPTAYLIYETMLEKGIQPDLDLYRILFRGYRLHGQEKECYEVLQQALSKGYLLDGPFCVELLSLICALYGPDTTLKFYQIMYPNSAPQLQQLGIIDFVDKWKVEHQHDFRPNDTEPTFRFSFSSDHIDQQSLSEFNESYALSILYQSICSQNNIPLDIVHLYDNYKHSILTKQYPKQASMRIIDWLVSSLLQTPTHESIDQAHHIFMDTITTLPLRQSISENLTVSPTILAHMHCLPPTPNLGTNITKAIELVRAIQKNNFIPLKRGTLTAIIKYFLNVHDRDEARKWYEFSKDSGVLITSPRVRHELEQ